MAFTDRIYKRLAGLALVLAVVAGPLAARAHAGRYHVYSCRTPDGEGAGTEGWSGSATASKAVLQNSCANAGGEMIAGLLAGTARTANPAVAEWIFAPPAEITVVGATLWRAGDAEETSGTSAKYQFGIAGPTEREKIEECVPNLGCKLRGNEPTGLSSENALEVPATHLGGRLFVLSECAGVLGETCPSGPGDANGYAAVVYLYAADLTLEQAAGPATSSVGGELASAAQVGGASRLTFDATDPGAGVYKVVFSVDGVEAQSAVLDEDAGRCRDVGQTSDGLPAFLYLQPCPASVAADVAFDTTRVPNGPHHLVVSVTDAAGNSTYVLDRNVTVYNAPPPGGPNGTNASAQATLAVGWKGSRSSHVTSRYGRAQTIEGRLTGAGGAPIGAAHVDVTSQAAYTGAPANTTAGAITDATGHFTTRLPAGSSSRTLRFAYSDRQGETAVATKTLSLTVRSGIDLRVRPQTVRADGTVRFQGRLLGGPIPRGGKTLVLEARSPGGAWLEFDVIRSDAHGRFRASYHFKFPGPAVYQFRVLCEAEADYPYARGASAAVRVFEH